MPSKDTLSSETTNEIATTQVKRRSKGEKTREKILMAAIDVLSVNGIKGTTHRAIATHADLQLSLTTYYFKDIQALIHEAFQLNSDNILSRDNTIINTAFTAISSLGAKELRKKDVREALCEQLSEMTSDYLINGIIEYSTPLAVEQLMMTEHQVSPELSLLVEKHGAAQLIPFEKMCSFFNKITPEIDAKILYTMLAQLQYSQLSRKENIDTDLIRKTIRRIISWILSVK